MSETSGGENRADQNREAPRASPPALPRGFQFLESPADLCEPAAHMVRVPRGIRSKEKLFSIFATALRFPKYFGWNWDAFEECLRDLSWLPADRPIVIVHVDLPFGSGGENRGIYLDVLRSAVNQTNRSLRVIWPLDCKATFSGAANEPR